MLDASDAVHEDHSAGFIHKNQETDADQSFSHISTHMHISNHCIVDDELDIAAFPVFSKRSSRKLRRTSIEIYRKSLHDAESVANDEEGDATPVTVITESDRAAPDVDMSSCNDDVVCNEFAFPITESDCSLMSPAIDTERVDATSDIKLPCIINSDSVVQPKSGILFLIFCIFLQN